MRLDIYRRSEHDGLYSYLAVPEGKPIPQEAINTDWELTAAAQEVDDDAGDLPDYHIDQPYTQIGDKGYAITSLKYVDGVLTAPPDRHPAQGV